MDDQDDHVIIDGITKNIYIDNVSVPEIFTYFRNKLHGAEWEAGDKILEKVPLEELEEHKELLYANLIMLLEMVSISYNGSCHLEKQTPAQWREAHFETLH